MEFHIDPFFTAVFTAIAMAIGAYLKTKPTFSNRLIPIVTLVVTFLGQIVSAATAQAGIGNVLHAVSNGAVYLTTVVVWLATTGFFSVGKNTIAGKTSDAKK